MEDPLKTREKQVVRNEKGQIIEGTANPNGRPKGTFSLKTLIVKKLEEQPELREKIIAELFEKEQALIFQMIDGKPRQNLGLDGGEDGLPLGVVILPKKDDSTLGTTA